jgi:hypothetical protein
MNFLSTWRKWVLGLYYGIRFFGEISVAANNMITRETAKNRLENERQNA